VILYLDPSAWIKRYVSEPGSELLRGLEAKARAAFMSRIGFVEMHAALGRRHDPQQIDRFRRDWRKVQVVEFNDAVAERAASIAQDRELRTIDAVHLASALSLGQGDLTFATWDRRLHAAAVARGLAVWPATLD